MKLPLRQVILILATGCFLVMTSGLVLCLHLHLAHDHDEPLQHDSEHCSFCQQLLVATKDFAVFTAAAPIEIDPIGQLVEPYLCAAPPQIGAPNLGARAPPA